MQSVFRFWANLSISKKLYTVVGIMAVLIAGELLVLQFAMRTLTAARAMVEGEATWSKAQKDAVLSLQLYQRTRNEADFDAFLEYLKIPQGDYDARMELTKEKPNLAIVRNGFLRGKVHPSDIDPAIALMQRFHWVDYISRSLKAWSAADILLLEMRTLGGKYRTAILAGDAETERVTLNRIKYINRQLTTLETEFSSALGEGVRWLERVILIVLTTVVVIAEAIGLTLTFLTSRSISRGIQEVKGAAEMIGSGYFSTRIEPRSNDEIGQVAMEINRMGELLQKSYTDLENRVQERTAEVRRAVELRDEFLSVASHELRTPFTALALRIQLLAAKDKSGDPNIQVAVQQTQKITELLDRLMDLTSLRQNSLEIRKEPCDLVALTKEAVSSMESVAKDAGSTISLQGAESLPGNADPLRTNQVLTNLISNAIKYGDGKPIEVITEAKGSRSRIQVRDHGIGISEEQRERIFERFERAHTDTTVGGLGLGLYISRRIVELHGGSLKVESRPGEGSTFTVEI